MKNILKQFSLLKSTMDKFWKGLLAIGSGAALTYVIYKSIYGNKSPCPRCQFLVEPGISPCPNCKVELEWRNYHD